MVEKSFIKSKFKLKVKHAALFEGISEITSSANCAVFKGSFKSRLHFAAKKFVKNSTLIVIES